ncbi:hypothetical protein CYY_004678 [Polysphondylium violaceum]|uniref:Tetratricopeptide SHNi-TPR domain-containing protein n=1 Tax=Polysphondylium violaceum TaxID=133409 RepID=A0A8J4PUR6_9MYCE|nr:hypothetical protein CYY_004678 [Polysphondylium violaceum]
MEQPTIEPYEEETSPLKPSSTTTTTTSTSTTTTTTKNDDQLNDEEKALVEDAYSKEKVADMLSKDKDYSSACLLLAEALENLTGVYGQLSIKAAPLYVKYGNTLVLSYKTEESDFMDILGSKLKNVADKEKNESSGSVNTDGAVQPVPDDASEEETPDQTKDKEQQDGEEEGEGEGEGEGDDQEDKDKKQENEQIEEDASPIEAAWEIFETARIIYEKEGNRESEISEIHICLGGLCIDSENIDNAIEEYTKALNIREGAKNKNYREISETYYYLGLAYQLQNNTKKAEHNYRLAIDILTNLLNTKQKSLDSKPSDPTEENKIIDEIQDIKNVIADLQCTLDEVVPIDTSKEQVPKEFQQEQPTQPTFATSADKTPVKPGTPINHLGVVGKASIRKNLNDELKSESSNTTSTSTNTATTPTPKRRLEDLMGGMKAPEQGDKKQKKESPFDV